MATNKKKFVIQPFKHNVQVDPDFVEKTWGVLDNAITQIYRKDASNLSFEELYRNSYTMVLHRHGDRLYSELDKKVRNWLSTVAEEVAACDNATFPTRLIEKWEDHKISMVMIRDILMYLDRIYVTNTKKTPVYDLGLEIFRDLVARRPNIKDRLLNFVLDLILRERNGEQIDRNLVRNITSMWHELGLEVYQEDFEKILCEYTSDFYRAESQLFISRNPCPEYMRMCMSRIEEEMARVDHYLAAESEEKLRRVVEQELVENHMYTLLEMKNSGLVPMLADDKLDDMARMYELFKNIPDGHTAMKQFLSKYIKETGASLVEDEQLCKDPVMYTQQLLDMKDKYYKIVAESFRKDKTFQNCTNQAFEHFVNLNSSSPEFLSLYLHEKLCKGLKGVTEDEAEIILEKAMMLFRYLQEKDVFEKYYKQHLAKRLLNRRSVSDELERSMIGKLKVECGYQFTSKLEGMFTDIRVSYDQMELFKDYWNDNNDGLTFDFTVNVLTTGYWPTQNVPPCLLSSELSKACTIFTNFYNKQHHGRRLTWQANMGHAEILASFGSRKHILSVTTYHMVVLLMFNQATVMTAAELGQATTIPEADLIRTLQALACGKYRILNKEPKSKEVAMSDKFSVNTSFNSKLTRIKIGTVSGAKETEAQKEVTKEKVEEDRKPQIEAAIVRTMKSRKTMDHNNLVAEVTKQLQSRFMPNPGVIKKRIESLIEREFLERQKGNARIYHYLA